MADVLPPLMQPSSTITMLHSRPSSSDAFQGQQQQSPRLAQAPRTAYPGQSGSYRGTAAAPVQPYAFQATPHLRQDSRTTSAPTPAQVQGRAAHAASTSTSSASDTSSAKDDSVIGSRPGSFINLSSNIPDLSLNTYDQPAKSSPNRYRRPDQRRTDSNRSITPQPSGSASPSGSGMASVAHLSQTPPPVQRQSSADDLNGPKFGQTELAKRYRRRSLNTLDTQNVLAPDGTQRPASSHGATSTPTSIRPVSFHQRTGSREGEFTQRNLSNSSLNRSESSTESVRLVGGNAANAAPSRDAPGVSVPPRGSSDPIKRGHAPSPLSRQTVDQENQPPAAARAASPVKQRSYASVAQSNINTASPAAQHLAALSDKDLNKGMKSRLRRAFSFGSAQELRRASAQNNFPTPQAVQQQPGAPEEELDAETMKVVRQQEAAGLGAGIYSGQAGFTGSTDNVSISSTASSASMMLRKMGKGAKKSARSIKGLFRPRSVIGIPAADGPVNVQASAPLQPSMAQVSMVTVEAERQKVNVNADPTEKVGGGTGYPKLERNSIDAVNATSLPPTRGSADGSDSLSRRSIVGSDKDRAEVLAAVKKGILKRSGTSSPAGSPVIRPNDGIPHINESPASSMPSTPKDGSIRTASFNTNNDYFSRMGSLTNSKSMPNTPGGGSRNISFSPRIQFHDAWSAQEYDRRGEIATCNRLTPMLAQQIKEELNTFKMEMEVHELSKPHTHFF